MPNVISKLTSIFTSKKSQLNTIEINEHGKGSQEAKGFFIKLATTLAIAAALTLAPNADANKSNMLDQLDVQISQMQEQPKKEDSYKQHRYDTSEKFQQFKQEQMQQMQQMQQKQPTKEPTQEELYRQHKSDTSKNFQQFKQEQLVAQNQYSNPQRQAAPARKAPETVNDDNDPNSFSYHKKNNTPSYQKYQAEQAKQQQAQGDFSIEVYQENGKTSIATLGEVDKKLICEEYEGLNSESAIQDKLKEMVGKLNTNSYLASEATKIHLNSMVSLCNEITGKETTETIITTSINERGI